MTRSQKKKWEILFEKAERNVGRAKASLYRRVRCASEIYKDVEFDADHDGDQRKKDEKLSRLFADIPGVNLYELLLMFDHFPTADKWQDYSMDDLLSKAIDEDNRTRTSAMKTMAKEREMQERANAAASDKNLNLPNSGPLAPHATTRSTPNHKRIIAAEIRAKSAEEQLKLERERTARAQSHFAKAAGVPVGKVQPPANEEQASSVKRLAGTKTAVLAFIEARIAHLTAGERIQFSQWLCEIAPSFSESASEGGAKSVDTKSAESSESSGSSASRGKRPAKAKATAKAKRQRASSREPAMV